MQVIYKQDVIKIEPQNAQGRRVLEIRRTKHKDYADKKRFEKETRRKQAISQPEVCAMPNCGIVVLCLICLCYFSYKLVTRYSKNEEKYFCTKNKYWAVCWIIKKRFQRMYMMKFFNYLELNGIRKGFMVGGIIVLTKNN